MCDQFDDGLGDMMAELAAAHFWDDYELDGPPEDETFGFSKEQIDRVMTQFTPEE